MHFLRKLTPFVLCTIFSLGIFNVAHADITTGLIGYWAFDEGSGTTAADSIGGDTLTLDGDAGWTASSKIGSHAIAFSGTSGGGASLASVINSSDTFTYAAWVFLNSNATGYQNLIAQGPTAGMWVFNQKIDYVFGPDHLSNTVITSGTWHHIAVVNNAGSVTFYLDGNSDGTASGLTSSFAANAMGCDNGNSGECINADLDDVRFYSRALSSSDITELYNFGSSPSGPPAGSWYSTSTSFFVHALPLSTGGGNPTYSYSTSTSFKIAGAANETAVGTSSSSSFQILSGFMRNLFKGPAPNYTLTHYHWRNDDGSETTATSKTSGVQDTAITSVSKLSTNRLRVEVANKGGTIEGYSSQQFRLEYGLKSTTCAAISSWTDVGAAGGDWDMIDSSNLTDGNNTTNITQ